MKKTLLLLTLFTFFFLFDQKCEAQAGSFDNSFGNKGVSKVFFGTDYGALNRCAIQSDGKIVSVGFFDDFINKNFLTARYKSNGELDSTFGTNGMVITDFDKQEDQLYGVIILNDGKILVIGEATVSGDKGFAMARYNSNGSLDNTFDGDGKVYTNITNRIDQAYQVKLQSDGKILLVGGSSPNSGNKDVTVVRYNANGSLDNTFDGDGIFTYSYGSDFDEALNIVLQKDGKILISGYGEAAIDNRELLLIRLNANGTLDNSFNGSGVVIKSLGPKNEAANSMVLQNDDKILIAGYVEDTTIKYFVMRYNANGSVDTTFGSKGLVLFPFDKSDATGASLVQQNDGKILMGGIVTINGVNQFGIIRLDNKGNVDKSFNATGFVLTTFKKSNSLSNLSLQKDGKIVACGFGFADSADFWGLILVRLNNDASSVSINEINDWEIAMYPNPIINKAQIKTDFSFSNGKMEILNVDGKLVKVVTDLEGKDFTLDKGDLSNGTYLLMFYEKEKLVGKKKVMITDY